MGFDGFFKIHRKLCNSELWLKEKFTEGQAWVDLICLARFKSGIMTIKNGQEIELEIGECGYSVLALADRWKWSRTKVKNFLNRLENRGKMIQQKTIANHTIIKILNYEYYQNNTTKSATNQPTKEQQTSQQKDTIEESKERKEWKEWRRKNSSTSSPIFADCKNNETINKNSADIEQQPEQLREREENIIQFGDMEMSEIPERDYRVREFTIEERKKLEKMVQEIFKFDFSENHKPMWSKMVEMIIGELEEQKGAGKYLRQNDFKTMLRFIGQKAKNVQHDRFLTDFLKINSQYKKFYYSSEN